MPARSWNQLMDDAGEAAQVFEPLADGTYDMKIVGAEHRQSQSGKDGYNVTAEVESGPYKGRKVFNTFWVSPDSPIAMGIFLRQFAALGLDRAFFSTEPTDEQIVAALQGKRLRAVVNTEEYQGKKNNRIKDVQAPVGAAPASIGGLPASGGAAPAAVPTVKSVPTAPTAVAGPPTVAVPNVPTDPWAGQAGATPSAPAWGAPPAPPAPAVETPGAALPAPPAPSLSGPTGQEPPF